MLIKHIRYREILFKSCGKKFPKMHERSVKIVLFWNSDRLRMHAVKHLANLKETAWIKDFNANRNMIKKCISDLKSLRCPYYRLGFEDPLCKECSHFKNYQCKEVVSHLEKVYLRILERIIREGGNKPRYACFFSDETEKDIIFIMPDKPVIVKAALHKNNVYNLMTGYAASRGTSYNKMLNRQVEKIRTESKTRNIKWCKRENWDVFDFYDDDDWRNVLKNIVINDI